MGKTKVIFSGVAWTIIQNVVSILYGIVSVPFLINYFGKEEYGLIGIAISVNVYIQLLDMGMTNSNVRFFSEFIAKGDKEKTRQLFGLTHLFYLILGILNTIILFGLSFFVDYLFKVTPEQTITLRNLLWILALNATFSWVSVCFDQYLRANNLIDWIKKRMTLLKLLQFLILVVTILFKFSIEVYFFCYVFALTIILPLTIIKVKHISPNLVLTPKYDGEMLKTVLPYAFSIFSFSIFQFSAFNFRALFLGNMSGPGAVAEFNIMNTIAMVVTVVSGSFVQVLLPIMTRLRVEGNSANIDILITKGTKYVNILLSTMIFLLCVSINEILTIYVGAEYTSLSKWMLLWLVTLLLSHRNVMTSMVFTEKKLKSVAIMGAIAMTVAFVCYIVLIPIYGVGGVVIGFTVHELTHALFYYAYFMPKKFNVNTWKLFSLEVFPSWLMLGLASIVVFYLFQSFSSHAILSASIKTLTCLVLFFIIIWFILFNKNDRDFVLSFVKRGK